MGIIQYSGGLSKKKELAFSMMCIAAFSEEKMCEDAKYSTFAAFCEKNFLQRNVYLKMRHIRKKPENMPQKYL